MQLDMEKFLIRHKTDIINTVNDYGLDYYDSTIQYNQDDTVIQLWMDGTAAIDTELESLGEDLAELFEELYRGDVSFNGHNINSVYSGPSGIVTDLYLLFIFYNKQKEQVHG